MDPLHFWKKHILIASTKTFTPVIAATKTCRFCKRSEPDTTFNTATHAISELLGRNNFISSDECDACNNVFSAYESHLSVFFMPYLTMVGVLGKKRIPAFHSRTNNGDEATRTIIKVAPNKNRQILLSNLNDYKIDIDNKKMSITFRKPPHKPLWVYKSLVKMALSILPEQYIPAFAESFKWLLNEPSAADYFVSAFITVLTRGKFPVPFAELYLAKRTIYKKRFTPEMTFVLGFGNIIIQIFLPFSNTFDFVGSTNKTPEFNLFPSVAFDKNSKKTIYTITGVQLAGDNSITYDETIHFSFQEADFNIDTGETIV